MTWHIDTVALHRARCKSCGAVRSEADAELLGQWMDDHDTGCGGWVR